MKGLSARTQFGQARIHAGRIRPYRPAFLTSGVWSLLHSDRQANSLGYTQGADGVDVMMEKWKV